MSFRVLKESVETISFYKIKWPNQVNILKRNEQIYHGMLCKELEDLCTPPLLLKQQSNKENGINQSKKNNFYSLTLNDTPIWEEPTKKNYESRISKNFRISALIIVKHQKRRENSNRDFSLTIKF